MQHGGGFGGQRAHVRRDGRQAHDSLGQTGAAGGQGDVAGRFAGADEHAVRAAFGEHEGLVDDVVAAAVAVKAAAVVAAEECRRAGQRKVDAGVAQGTDSALRIHDFDIHAGDVRAVGVQATGSGAQRQAQFGGIADGVEAVAGDLGAVVAVGDGLDAARSCHVHLREGEDEGALRLVAHACGLAVDQQRHLRHGVAGDGVDRF